MNADQRLQQAMAAALLVIMDNQRHRPGLERHNRVRSELSTSAWLATAEGKDKTAEAQGAGLRE